MELYRVVRLMHIAGVVHGDLYFSNVMWRERNGRVEIKLIDFDCSHLLSENDFVPQVRMRFEAYFFKLCGKDAGVNYIVEFNKEHDYKFVSIVELKVTELNACHWHELASNNKLQIDSAFRALQLELMSSSNFQARRQY